jgi:hypothetical protein
MPTFKCPGHTNSVATRTNDTVSDAWLSRHTSETTCRPAPVEFPLYVGAFHR